MRAHPQIALEAVLAKIGVLRNVALARFSTLRVGGPARYFIKAETEEEVRLLQLAALEHDLPMHILSGGSNTLFSDQGFDGLVLKLGSGFDFIEPQEDALGMTVGAATSFARVTKAAIAWGWTHAVGWCGTPGLIGGAIKMNAGTRFGEIKDAIKIVHGFQGGKKKKFTKKNIEFWYRGNNLPSDFIICRAHLAYPEELKEPALNLIKKAMQYKEKRKKTQPTKNSLGSFFKNPEGLFAAQLIERCNLKGTKYKGAQISPLHANFIINYNNAGARDILHLASLTQRAVFETHGIALKPEVRMVGNFHPQPLWL